MGGGDWKDSGYGGRIGRTEDIRTSHTLDRRSRRSADSLTERKDKDHIFLDK